MGRGVCVAVAVGVNVAVAVWVADGRAVTVGVIVPVTVGCPVVLMVTVAPSTPSGDCALVMAERTTVVPVTGRLAGETLAGNPDAVAVGVAVAVPVAVGVGNGVRVGDGVAVRLVAVTCWLARVGVDVIVAVITVPVITSL